MKKLRVLILALACLLVLAGCSCKHEWTAADCVTPASCTQCGETEGEALGHTWTDATCTTVRTCSRCGRTEGDPLGHVWVDATCIEPKTCSACGEILGEALGHTWLEATTEAPATCSLCGVTEGEKIATDPRFVTVEAEPFFGRWESKLYATGTELGIADFTGTLDGVLVTTFGETGQMVTNVVLTDEAAFRDAMADYAVKLTLKALEEEGLDKEEADAVAQILLQKDVESYVRASQDEMEIGSLVDFLLAAAGVGGSWCGEFVYYVQDGELFSGTDWDSEMYGIPFEFIGTTLLLADYMEYKAVDPA